MGVGLLNSDRASNLKGARQPAQWGAVRERTRGWGGGVRDNRMHVHVLRFVVKGVMGFTVEKHAPCASR